MEEPLVASVSLYVSGRDAPPARYDTKLWMRDLKEGAAYLPK